jgi:predicted site-specific integrase-resolvase
MSVSINNQNYYMIAEACEIAGTHRNTLLRWIRDGRFEDVTLRDRNGWRLFTEDDIKRLKLAVNTVKKASIA